MPHVEEQTETHHHADEAGDAQFPVIQTTQLLEDASRTRRTQERQDAFHDEQDGHRGNQVCPFHRNIRERPFSAAQARSGT